MSPPCMSGFSHFLPHSKNMFISLIGHFKLPVGVSVFTFFVHVYIQFIFIKAHSMSHKKRESKNTETGTFSLLFMHLTEICNATFSLERACYGVAKIVHHSQGVFYTVYSLSEAD